MSCHVCLSSINQSTGNPIFIEVPEINYENLFSIDRVIRSSFESNLKSESNDIVNNLTQAGYIFSGSEAPVTSVPFYRAWDECLLNNGESFLVTFSNDAHYELRDKFILATPNPMLYSAISPDYLFGNGSVLLINQEHEPIYPSDLAWVDHDQTTKSPIGPLTLVKNQFFSESEYLKAKKRLIASGYLVTDELFN
jgi:hypothetical protein